MFWPVAATSAQLKWNKTKVTPAAQTRCFACLPTTKCVISVLHSAMNNKRKKLYYIPVISAIFLVK